MSAGLSGGKTHFLTVQFTPLRTHRGHKMKLCKLSIEVSLPIVRPLQPSQFRRGMLDEIRYGVQVMRDDWRRLRGKTRIWRCDHCWQTLSVFTPHRKLMWIEKALRAPGIPLAKYGWWQCPFCHSRTSETYRFQDNLTHTWPSGGWTYRGVFGI